MLFNGEEVLITDQFRVTLKWTLPDFCIWIAILTYSNAWKEVCDYAYSTVIETFPKMITPLVSHSEINCLNGKTSIRKTF